MKLQQPLFWQQTTRLDNRKGLVILTIHDLIHKIGQLLLYDFTEIENRTADWSKWESIFFLSKMDVRIFSNFWHLILLLTSKILFMWYIGKISKNSILHTENILFIFCFQIETNTHILKIDELATTSVSTQCDDNMVR